MILTMAIVSFLVFVSCIFDIVYLFKDLPRAVSKNEDIRWLTKAITCAFCIIASPVCFIFCIAMLFLAK